MERSNTVHALDGDDLLYMLKAAGGLALGYEQGVLVGPGHVAGHALRVIVVEAPAAVAARAVAAVPEGRELGPGDELFRLLDAFKLGYDKSGGAGVEHFEHRAAAYLIDAHEGCEAGA